MSKGSNRRPSTVSSDTYAQNWDKIFKPKKQTKKKKGKKK